MFELDIDHGVIILLRITLLFRWMINEDENEYWVVICYLSCDQTLDCVESEWPEIKTFRAFLSHDKNCHQRQTCLVIVLQVQAMQQTCNSRRWVDFASCTPCQVRCKPWPSVETILADLKFVSRSKTQPAPAASGQSSTYSSPSSFQHLSIEDWYW